MAKSEGVSVRKFRPKNGESWEDVADRTRSFVTNIISNHSTNSAGSKLARPGKPAPTTRTAAVREASAAKRTLSSPLIPATDSRGMERSRSDSSNESIASTASESSRRERPHSAPTKPTGGCGECPGRLDQRARRILVVTHGGTIREMINSHIPAARAKNSAPNCSLTIMRLVPCQPSSSSPVEAIATSFYSTISGHSSADMSRIRSDSPGRPSSPAGASGAAAAAVQYVLVTWADVAHLTSDSFHDRCNEEEGEDA
mmetsp:Transcript_17829/g.49372  ORF Transcript_17829/g.49372 Transcript_17829/m.49372 type:complete len:257 (+) Transcript_17829:518-1288(+)